MKLRSTIFVLALLLMIPSVSSAQIDLLNIREGTGVPEGVRPIYEKGADYLARTQKPDGSWGKGTQFHGEETNGICGLCVMAFLSTGEDPNFGKYAINIRRALRHIIRDQNAKTGYIKGNMYVHGFAMLALSEAYGAVDDDMLWAGQTKDNKTRTIGEALELAVRLAVTSQKKNPTNGWRYGPGDNSADTSIVGAVLMGLLAARNAGIEVPDESIDKALEYMKSMTSEDSGQVGYSGLGGFGDSTARSSIACLVYSIGKRREWKEFASTKDYVSDNFMNSQSSSWPYYTRYYQAQALFQADYDTWQKWNRETIRMLSELQSNDGQLGDSQHGPTYATAMSLLALALNFRFLPIYER